MDVRTRCPCADTRLAGVGERDARGPGRATGTWRSQWAMLQTPPESSRPVDLHARGLWPRAVGHRVLADTRARTGYGMGLMGIACRTEPSGGMGGHSGRLPRDVGPSD